MAAIAVEPIVAGIIELITGAVAKGTEAAVVAAISAFIDEAIEVAVTSAISAAIASSIASAVSATITTEAIERALQQKLSKAVEDVISSRGVRELSEAISAVPSVVAVNKLAKEVIDKISPYLWVYKDPAFFRLNRVIRALRAIQNGEKPPKEPDDDDDCDEEKCRYFKRPQEAVGDSDDFLFFTVFGSSECKEGDEVYSMSAQWKKLKSLVDAPIGGHYVSQLFQELFESCVDEEEGNYVSFVPAAAKPTRRNKFVKVSYGKMVYFGNEKIYNIFGSSKDKRLSNWLKAYLVSGYGECEKCYIANEDPVCGHTNPLKGNIVGGHMWSPQLKIEDKSLYYYILPICKRHNKPRVYDKPQLDGSGWLMTSSDAFAMKITSTNKVPGWKGKYSHLIGLKTAVKLMAGIRLDGAQECHEIVEPEKLTNWVLEGVHHIALEFAKGPIKAVFQEVSSMVLGKLQEIIKSAGSDAISWAQSEGHDIMLQSLIPLWGIIQAVKRLSSLQSDAIDKFHNGAQLALTSYKIECLSDEEQKRRKQRLIEETDKVIASKEWEDRISAFEKAIASKVPELVDP